MNGGRRGRGGTHAHHDGRGVGGRGAGLGVDGGREEGTGLMGAGAGGDQ